MIKFALKWLWDFNHIHQWTFKEKINVSGIIGASDVLIYECRCGELQTIDPVRD